jgi:hypothetical protein
MGLFDFWKPKYRGSGNTIEDAINAAVHQGGHKIGHESRIKVLKVEGTVHEGWHITTYAATIQKTGGGG